MKKLSAEEVVARLAEKQISAVEPYINNQAKIRFRCDICNHSWRASPGNVFSQTGCPACSAKAGLEKRVKRNIVIDQTSTSVVLSAFGIGKQPCKITMDIGDYLRIKDTCGILYANDQGYVLCRNRLTGKTVRLSRLIMAAKESDIVDHKNHDTLDNRRKNLRICSHTENMQNRKNNPKKQSGRVGVVYDEVNKKWRASITKNKRKILLGRHKTLREAIAARAAAEKIYFGEYSYEQSTKETE